MMIVKRSLWNNTSALSIMYDAVFFATLVSLSGAILLPAMYMNIASETSMQKHREELVEEALSTYLVSRENNFSYRVAGGIIDDVARGLGLQNSSDGLYGAVMEWLLAREQLHKTNGQLIAENLGCQFRLPVSFLGTNRFNFLTDEYDKQLIDQTHEFFSRYLGDKYGYNISGLWQPIKGVGFGGELHIGQPVPTGSDCYTAKGFVMMPYTPKITIGSTDIVFSKHWVMTELFQGSFGNITVLENITSVLQEYNLGVLSSDEALNATCDNMTSLALGFFVNGITNMSGEQVFPGLVSTILDMGFTWLKQTIVDNATEVVDGFMGEGLGLVDDVFAGLNDDLGDNPLMDAFHDEINRGMQGFVNESMGSFEEMFDSFELMIQENVTRMVSMYITPYIRGFVSFLLDEFDIAVIALLPSMICDWIFDRISVNRAMVTLTIWPVRQ